jgi:hypothetical protein
MRRIMSLLTVVAVVAAAAACSKQDGTTSRSSPDTSKLKKLHRGELSAVDSYAEAIRKLPNVTAIDLDKFRQDHADAAERLRSRIVALGATPDGSAGAWGDWAEAVTKGGAAFGEDAGLRARQAGEKHGENEYEEALRNDDVDAETKQIIRDVLLPRQKEHVSALQRAIKTN